MRPRARRNRPRRASTTRPTTIRPTTATGSSTLRRSSPSRCRRRSATRPTISRSTCSNFGSSSAKSRRRTALPCRRRCGRWTRSGWARRTRSIRPWRCATLRRSSRLARCGSCARQTARRPSNGRRMRPPACSSNRTGPSSTGTAGPTRRTTADGSNPKSAPATRTTTACTGRMPGCSTETTPTM